MLIINIIIFLGVAFVGYLIGRFSDYYLNFWVNDPAWAPHHWIYGALLILINLFFPGSLFWLSMTFFGIGLFISDLKDFLDLKIIGKDNKDKSTRRFWHID